MLHTETLVLWLVSEGASVGTILGLAFAGGALSALVAGTLLLTSKYSRTWLPLVRNSYAFWGYLLCYGTLGGAATFIVFSTPLGRVPAILTIPNYIFWPVAIAIIGTLAKTTLVGAMPGADQFDITVRAALLLFEPELLAHIGDDEYFALKKIARRFAPRYADLNALKRAIQSSIPDRMEHGRRLAFLDELEKCATTEEAMIRYLRLVGPRWAPYTFGQADREVQLGLFDSFDRMEIAQSLRDAPKSMHTSMAAEVAARRAT